MRDPATRPSVPFPMISHTKPDPYLPERVGLALERLTNSLDDRSRFLYERLRTLHAEVALMRAERPPPRPRLELIAEPPWHRQALDALVWAAQWIGLGVTLLAAACELVTVARPELVGPSKALIAFMRGLIR